MIRRIVRKVLAEMKKTSLPLSGGTETEKEKPTAVVFFCGCPDGLDEVSRDLSEFRRRFSLVGGYSQAAEALLDRDYMMREACSLLSQKELYEAVRHTGTVLFPNLSQNTAAKVVCGIRDTPGSEIMGYALKKGKRVLAARSYICPGNAKDPYSLFLRTVLENLEKLGVQLYSRGKLDSILDGKERLIGTQKTAGAPLTLVTVEMVREARAKGISKIQTEGRCIVTPLARDEAKKLSVELPK